MLTVVLVIALAGCGIGYIVAASALTDARREYTERRRDLYRARLHDELDLLDPPYGAIISDTRTLPDVLTAPTKRQTRVLRWRWRWTYLLTCPTCSGAWGTIATFTVWLGGTALLQRKPVVPAEDALPALAAGIGAQLLGTMTAIKIRLWGDDNEQ